MRGEPFTLALASTTQAARGINTFSCGKIWPSLSLKERVNMGDTLVELFSFSSCFCSVTFTRVHWTEMLF